MLIGLLALTYTVGCRELPEPNLPPGPTVDLSGHVPSPGHHLDRANGGEHMGLLVGIGPDGTPVREGANMDPLIVEARRFYDTLGAPGNDVQSVDYPDPFTGAAAGPGKTAPLTLTSWKETFGFPHRDPDEALEAYRQRTGIVVYYNRNELGLGRELGCADFVDGMDAQGQPLIGLACFVTNYGAMFRDEARSLALALEGSTPRNTVCITYRPSMEAGYQVQFYTYGADGRRQEWAQLDSLGARPHPQVCINCHGGSYDSSKHLARDARFLPLDPNMVAFTQDVGSPRGRGPQEEPIRRMNAASLRTPLAPAQREMLDSLYLGGVGTPGVVSQPDWTLPGWNDTPANHDLFSKVVKPYCVTCHLGLDRGRGGMVSSSHHLFGSALAFKSFPMGAVVCGTFSMPNAQPTMIGLWDGSRGPIAIADQSFSSGADALMAAFSIDRAQCNGLTSIGSCNRGPDPDSLCGNAQSGMACNRATGRCVPDFADFAMPIVVRGFCRTDGTRTCPSGMTCKPLVAPIAGLESYDGECSAAP